MWRFSPHNVNNILEWDRLFDDVYEQPWSEEELSRLGVSKVSRLVSECFAMASWRRTVEEDAILNLIGHLQIDSTEEQAELDTRNMVDILTKNA